MDLSGNLKEVEKTNDAPVAGPPNLSPTKAGNQSELELSRHIDQKQVELTDFLEKDDRADLLQTSEIEEVDMFSFSPAKTASTKPGQEGVFASNISKKFEDISGSDGMFKVESTTTSVKTEPAGGDTTHSAKQLESDKSHMENLGYFERVSPNMMDFGFETYSTAEAHNEKTVKQQKETTGFHEFHEYLSEILPDHPCAEAPIGDFTNVGRLPQADSFHCTQSEPTVNIQYGIEDHLVPTLSSGMTTSLDEIQQPNFYESEDSSSNKTDLPVDDAQKTNLSSSLILDNDDFLDNLPNETGGTLSVQYSSASAESQDYVEPLQKRGMEDSFTTFSDEPTISSMESPFWEGCGKRSISPEDHFEQTKRTMGETEASPSPIPEWVEVTTSHTKELEYVENQELPGYKIEDIIEQKVNQGHAEISAFQDFLSQGVVDDFDRSDNSASPNSVNSQPFSTKIDFPKEKSEFYPEDPVQIFGGSKEKSHSPHDDIPPPIPPHSREVEREILSKTIAKEVFESKQISTPDRSGEVPQIQICPGQPPMTHEFQEFKPTVTKSEPETEKTSGKVDDFDDMEEFLPKGSFESIPLEYKVAPVPQEAPTVSSSPNKKEDVKAASTERSPSKSDEPEKPETAETSLSWEVMPLSQEAQQILNILNPKAWFDPSKLHPTVGELVYWRDPKKSGAVFGSIFVILIALTFLSLISVFAYTSLAILSATFAFRVYKNVLQAINKTQDGHPFKEYLELDLTLQGDKSQEICQAVINYANQAVIKFRHLFLVEDLIDSAKFAGVLYVLTYVGSCFNGLTLIILGFIALSALPKVYELNKTIIDMYMDLASAKFAEINSKVRDALPFGKKEKAQ